MQINKAKPIQQLTMADEEIILAQEHQLLAKLVVLPEAQTQRRIGHAKGVIFYMDDDFDDPLPDALNCPQS